MTREQIDDILTYPAPFGDKAAHYSEIRGTVRFFARRQANRILSQYEKEI